MRVAKYAPEYQLTFSLLNGDPNGIMPSWEIKQAIAGKRRIMEIIRKIKKKDRI